MLEVKRQPGGQGDKTWQVERKRDLWQELMLV